MTRRAPGRCRTHRLVGLVATGLLLLAVPSCSGNDATKAAEGTSRGQSSDGVDRSAGATTTTEVATDPVMDTGGIDTSPVDPCAGFTAEQISALLGFTVDGDGVAADNGLGYLSCSFRAALDDSDSAGASVTIGAQRSSESIESIEDALTQMGGPDARVLAIEVGDGGWLLLGEGFSELRARLGTIQLDVNVITPLGESTDLAKPTIDLATTIATGLAP